MGLECMSWGLIPNEDAHSKGEATVLRGSRVARAAVQLALGTQWNFRADLDVLVMDMPPGTGDLNVPSGASTAALHLES